MKTLIQRYFCLGLVLLLVWSCSEKWNGVDPNAVEDFEIKGLTLDNFPFIDCSTSTGPLRDMVMYNLLDIPYDWGMNVVTGSQYEIFFSLPEGIETGSDEHKAFASETLPRQVVP